MQYERWRDLDFKRGSFPRAWRRIDVYPAEAPENAWHQPVWTMKSTARYVRPTGSLYPAPAATVFPSSHMPLLPRESLCAPASPSAELRERIDFFIKENRPVEQQRIEQRTRFDLEMLYEMGFCKGIENYPALLTHKRTRTEAND